MFPTIVTMSQLVCPARERCGPTQNRSGLAHPCPTHPPIVFPLKDQPLHDKDVVVATILANILSLM